MLIPHMAKAITNFLFAFNNCSNHNAFSYLKNSILKENFCGYFNEECYLAIMFYLP